MVLLDLIFGFLLILAGRTLFWLCVGIIGFLVGVQCATAVGLANGWMELLTAMALGGLGALLTIGYEWFMVVFGVGFLGGGYLLMNIFPPATSEDPYVWLIFVVGGIIGMCLMVIVFDWTLIIMSSLLGATLIANAFHSSPQLQAVLFVGSVLVGIMVQYLTLNDTPHHNHSLGRT